MSLKGKHALITGASRGIGRGIALKLAENGVKIAIHYYRNADAANDTLAKVRERGSSGFILHADVNRPEEIPQMMDQVKSEFGALDFFVSNPRPEIPRLYKPPLETNLRHGQLANHSPAAAFLAGVQ